MPAALSGESKQGDEFAFEPLDLRGRHHDGRAEWKPWAPVGKAPLQILVAEETIEEAKVKAIRSKTNVSRVVEELLQGWLEGTYKLKE